MRTNYHQEFYRTNAEISSASARSILAVLLRIYPAQSVLDVGCGIGTWGRAGLELGLKTYRGVDGDYVDRKQLLVDPAHFSAGDLCQPLVLGQKFDLALCMEVAEHLPAATATTLVRSLCAHAPVVLFSAAIPRQGGVDHVNEQWQSYWAGLFAEQGYEVYDCIRPRVWNRPEVAEYYKQNALVYVDRQNAALGERFHRDATETRSILDLVHPSTYQIKSDPLRWPLGAILRHLPAILARVIRNRVFSR